MKPTTQFPTDPTGLPAAEGTRVVGLRDGEEYELRIAPVAKRVGDSTVRMLAYNGSIPGPTLRVRQGAEIVVHVVNEADLDTTVHWHGLRLENRYDGTHETQRQIPGGGRYTARVVFPDPGVYWYHPHTREDYAQDMGLYGNLIVEPDDPSYWPPVHREVPLTLDDVLIEDGMLAAYSRDETTHSAMGRFGNVLLVDGETERALAARLGEVVRFYLTNTANTRVFRVQLPGAQMKLVGGDSGRVEREELVEAVTLGPSERAVVDVLFDRSGELALEHRTPDRTYRLASIAVSQEAAAPLEQAFGALRTDPELSAERARLDRRLAAEPDKLLAFSVEMHMGGSEHHAHAGGHHGHGPPAEIEWEDEMVEVNRMTTSANTLWKLIDRATGAENQAIDWRFKVGDRVKIRIVNEMDSDHPMHHPFHIHGAGRFLVLARDGAVEPNLAWSDTVLVPTGQTVDILLDVTNPGRWMAHCHIPEHHESGMVFSFDVDP